MSKKDNLILIKNTNSDYIDKIIVILKEKTSIPEEKIIEQAEKIVYEYERKNNKDIKEKIKKLGISFLFIFLFVSIAVGLKLYF